MKKEESIGYNLGIINQLIGRHFIKDIPVEKNPHVSPIQIKILKYLLSNPNQHIYQHDIEKYFEIRRSTVSGVLKTMGKNNMIKRVSSNKNDARLKEIKVTSAAKKRHEEMETYLNQLEQKISNNLTIEEKESFLNISHKIQKNLRNDLEDHK
jgi:DNA-binding MarR family transcriptional regulator